LPILLDGKIKNSLDKSELKPLLKDPSFIQALDFLNGIEDKLSKVKGSSVKSTDIAVYIAPILAAEKLPSKHPWRCVVDMPRNKENKYQADPVVQFCSGPPSYHRLVITFSEHEIKTEVRTDSVVKSPDLSLISSSGINEGVFPKTLAEMKQACDSDQIPRIAILGSARIYPYLPSPPKEEALKGVTPEEWMVKSEIARRASQRAGLATIAAEIRSEKLSAVAQKTQEALVYLEAQVDPHKKMRAGESLRIAVENEKKQNYLLKRKWL
jgi:hypothetical protein